MVDVLFGESEAGTMRDIKLKHRRQSGGRDEVLCLGFMLDAGDIKESVNSQYRKDLICSMYVQDQWGGDKELNEECQKLGDVYSNELKRLQEFLEKGESVRIWYSNAPYSICGFYHLCSLLQNCENEIFVVKLPEYEVVSVTGPAHKPIFEVQVTYCGKILGQATGSTKKEAEQNAAYKACEALGIIKES